MDFILHHFFVHSSLNPQHVALICDKCSIDSLLSDYWYAGSHGALLLHIVHVMYNCRTDAVQQTLKLSSEKTYRIHHVEPSS